MEQTEAEPVSQWLRRLERRDSRDRHWREFYTYIDQALERISRQGASTGPGTRAATTAIQRVS